MEELIVVRNDVASLSIDVSKTIVEIEREIKFLKEKEELIKQTVLEEMERKGIIKVETDDLLINYIAPSDRETLNSKKLKAEKPDTYDEYVKITPVKSIIRIKVKEKTEEKEKLEKIKEILN